MNIKAKTIKPVLILTLCLAVAAFASYAYAGKARGGSCPVVAKSAACPATGSSLASSEAVMIKLQDAEMAFRKSTEELGKQIGVKQLALNAALMEEKVDSKKVMSLQEELQKLQNKYDREELAFVLKTREEIPESAAFFKYHHNLYAKNMGNTPCAGYDASCPAGKTKRSCPVK